MSRKYRQPGYQDHAAEESRDRPKPGPDRTLTPEERIQRRSLRHATAREANEVIRCHHCGRNIANFGTISAETECPHCRAPLHCCRTCRQFDSSARWQCRAPITEAVADKSKANSCAQYSPRVVLDTTGRRIDAAREPDSPRAQFDSLFKR
jgi:hypothetical protein